MFRSLVNVRESCPAGIGLCCSDEEELLYKWICSELTDDGTPSEYRFASKFGIVRDVLFR